MGGWGRGRCWSLSEFFYGRQCAPEGVFIPLSPLPVVPVFTLTQAQWLLGLRKAFRRGGDGGCRKAKVYLDVGDAERQAGI